MRDEAQTQTSLGQDDVRRLAESLSKYANQLPECEKLTVCEMLVQAMAPLDRFLYLDTSDLLSPEEEAELNALKAESNRGKHPAITHLCLIVKATRQCTLRCAYCHDWRDKRKATMGFSVMAHMIAHALADHKYVHFIWHGGEPTLLPISFYEKAFLVQAHLRQPDQEIRNSFQTNATTLTRQWASFFQANKIQVGVSIDGPAPLHNRHRVYQSGEGSYDHAIRGLNLLKEHKVQFSGLVVVDEATLEFGARRLLDFLGDQGIRRFGLLPVKPQNEPAAGPNTPTSHYIEPARMNAFLTDLYDAWLDRGDPEIKIRELETLKSQIRGVSARACTLSGDCWGHYYAVEADGNVTACDVFNGDPRYTLGNITRTSFEKISNSGELLKLKQESRDAVESMRACCEFPACNGWCPHERYVSIRHNKDHRNDCCGLRDLIKHLRHRMADEPKMLSQKALSHKHTTRKSKVAATHRVLLGPRLDLHTGVHKAFSRLLTAPFQYRRTDSVHTFLMADGQHGSPFRFFHLGEFADFGPGQALVHTARWPVLNRRAWVTDTDDFIYPVVCGRHFLDPDFRKAFRREWSAEFREALLKRATNMLTAYTHPSCKAIFYRSESNVRDARVWLAKLGLGTLEERYLEKIKVLYPAQESCPPEVLRKKWDKGGPLTVVFCGRDYESKNGEMALAIFDRLSREFAENRFVYIGHVPPEELRRRRRRPGSVEYHDSLPHKQILSLLREAHVLFHPSKFEGLGIIFLEAAASGMAVITATGGAMQHVEELFGTGGAMLVDRNAVAPSEEAAKFETHLRHLLNHASAAKGMAHHNFTLATVGKLSPERSRSTLLEVYQDAVERPAPSPLTLQEIPFRSGTPLRLNRQSLELEEMEYRKETNITQGRFLI